MTFNEFNRELNKRVPDPQMAYMLTLLFESHRATLTQMDEMAQMIVTLANQLRGFVDLHETTQDKVTKLATGQFREGVDVHSESVADDPDKKKH